MRVMMRRCVVARAGAIPFGNGLGRCQDEPAGLDAFGTDQIVGQVSDLTRGPAQHDDLKTAAGVEVEMRGGHDPLEVVMLQIGQPASDPGDMVVIDQGDDSHRLAVVVLDGLLDQECPSSRGRSLRLAWRLSSR